MTAVIVLLSTAFTDTGCRIIDPFLPECFSQSSFSLSIILWTDGSNSSLPRGRECKLLPQFNF